MNSRLSFTIHDLKSSAVANINQHLFAQEKKTIPKSKYGNKKKEVDGIVFDSEKESVYYKKLLLLVKAGEIGLLKRQVSYELNPGGTYSYRYISDFEFVDKNGGYHVVDVKGFKTKEYLKKKKLMLKIHGIKIEEK